MELSEELLKELKQLRGINESVLEKLKVLNKEFPYFLNYPQKAITIATPTKPQDPEVLANSATGQTGYDRVVVFHELNRISPVCWVMNDGLSGAGTLYAVSTSDGIKWSGESEILVREFRAFFNVHEIRVRSPALVNYRVSEYMPGYLA